MQEDEAAGGEGAGDCPACLLTPGRRSSGPQSQAAQPAHRGQQQEERAAGAAEAAQGGDRAGEGRRWCLPGPAQVKLQLWPLDRKLGVITQAKEFVRKQEAEMEVSGAVIPGLLSYC